MALKPSQDRLFNKLAKFRNEIAECAGVVPRGVMSDPVLRNVADAKPLTESALLDVTGVSQLFVEKYGKVFLDEIKRNLAGDFDPEKVTKVARDVYRFVDLRLSLKEIAKKMFLTETLVANAIKEAALNNAIIPIGLYYSAEEYEKIKDFQIENPKCSATRLKNELGLIIDENHIKIAMAVVTCEMK